MVAEKYFGSFFQVFRGGGGGGGDEGKIWRGGVGGCGETDSCDDIKSAEIYIVPKCRTLQYQDHCQIIKWYRENI